MSKVIDKQTDTTDGQTDEWRSKKLKWAFSSGKLKSHKQVIYQLVSSYMYSFDKKNIHILTIL